MTREEIIKGLYRGYGCTEKDECFESGCKDCLNIMFNKYEQKIRTDAIDDCIKTLAKSEDTILSDRQYYTLMELKEQK